jgi:ERCC4-type nuclease
MAASSDVGGATGVDKEWAKKRQFSSGVYLNVTPEDPLAKDMRSMFPRLVEAGIVRFEPQKIGDMGIVGGERVLWLGERKTLADLAASRIGSYGPSNRWESQKMRLLAHEDVPDITFAIEGDEMTHLYGPDADPEGFIANHRVSRRVLVSMLRNVELLNARVTVAFYASKQDMCRRLVFITLRNYASMPAKDLKRRALVNAQSFDSIAMPLGSSSSSSSAAAAPTPYNLMMAAGSGISIRRGENMTPAAFYLATLCGVPGVGPKAAQDIAGSYPTLMALVDSMTQARNANHLCMIDGIGPKTSKQIYAYIMNGRPAAKTTTAAPAKRRRRSAAAAKARTLPAIVSSQKPRSPPAGTEVDVFTSDGGIYDVDFFATDFEE